MSESGLKMLRTATALCNYQAGLHSCRTPWQSPPLLLACRVVDHPRAGKLCTAVLMRVLSQGIGEPIKHAPPAYLMCFSCCYNNTRIT